MKLNAEMSSGRTRSFVKSAGINETGFVFDLREPEMSDRLSRYLLGKQFNQFVPPNKYD